jgi:hypothetical protein
VYAFVLKRKTGDEVLAALTKWFKTVRDTPKFVQSDGGSEFLNKGVTAFFDQHDIDRRIADPGDHHGQGVVERFHGTLRRLFRMYEDAFKEPWKKGFDDLVYNYNHRVHRSIGVEPVNAKEDQGLARQHKQYLKAMTLEAKFHIGDMVRKAVNRSTLFDKGKIRWSEKVHTIVAQTGHRFELDDGSEALSYDLQLVKTVEKHTTRESLEPVRAARKVQAKVTRNLTKEGVAKENVISSKVDYVRVKENGKFYIGKVVRQLRNEKWVVDFGPNVPEGEYTTEELKKFKWTKKTRTMPTMTRMTA